MQARGVEERHSKGNLGKEILDAVADGQRSDIDLPAPDGEELDRQLRPAVALVSAWMADLARKQRVDTACWPRAPTWWRCFAATPTLGSCGVGGRNWWATGSSVSCRAKPG